MRRVLLRALEIVADRRSMAEKIAKKLKGLLSRRMTRGRAPLNSLTDHRASALSRSYRVIRHRQQADGAAPEGSPDRLSLHVLCAYSNRSYHMIFVGGHPCPWAKATNL